VPRGRPKTKRSNGKVTRSKQEKPNGKPAKASETQEPKRYDLTREERAAYSMIKLRSDLAKEKMDNAKQLAETAQMLQQQWAGDVFRRRAINPRSRANIDADTGVITVFADAQGAPPPPEPPPPEPPAEPPQDEAPA